MALEHLTELDKIVRSTLEGVEESVPSSVWDSIASKLDAIAGAAAAGTAISSAVSGSSAAAGSAASGSAAGSAAAGSAAAGTTAAGSAAAGTTAAGSAAAGTTAAAGAAAGSAATGAAGAAAGGAAIAASSNVITIALASVAAAGVIGGGAALVLTNSNNEHIIEEPKPIAEVVADTTEAPMPEDTIDLVEYVRHRIPVIDETEPVENEPEAAPEKREEPEEINEKREDEPAPMVGKPAVQWEIQPKKSQSRFAINAGYINSLDRSKIEMGLNGVYVGFTYNFPINANMGIAPGIYYSYVRKSKAYRWEDFEFYLSEDGAKIQEHYLDFPVYFNYRFDVNNDIAVRALMGPTFSLGLSSSIDYEGKTYNAFDSDYSRFDVMLGGGLTFEYLKKYNFHIGYDFGLINKNTGDDGPHHKRNKFYVGVGYMF